MEKQEIVRSNSPYATPIVIVQKKDGSLRICPDYRKLNKISIFQPEPMVTAEDLVTKMKSSQYFSKLDLCKGYWQIALNEADIPKTAFITQERHFEFTRIPFGLVNSGLTLVKGLKKILGDIENVRTHIDDIIIYTDNWKQHLTTLDNVFQRLKQANITIRPTKCSLGQTKTEFICQVISQGVITPNEDNIKKVREAAKPRTKK